MIRIGRVSGYGWKDCILVTGTVYMAKKQLVSLVVVVVLHLVGLYIACRFKLAWVLD